MVKTLENDLKTYDINEYVIYVWYWWLYKSAYIDKLLSNVVSEQMTCNQILHKWLY